MEIIKTEYANGKYGADYGSSIRIIARSPSHVMFVGYGINLVTRQDVMHHHCSVKIAESIPDIFLDQSKIEKVTSAFGDNIIDCLKSLKRGFGTILVEGGGDKLPLPNHIRKKNTQEEYDAITPTKTNLVAINKKCNFCNGNLKPKLNSISFDYDQIKTVPCYTVDDCQRHTNLLVFSVNGVAISYGKDMWNRISFFHTWDGETYIDDYFCSDRCAMDYGRMVVKCK